MQDAPDHRAILANTIRHLRDATLPTLSGRALFEMRVTISALELVQREIDLKTASDEAELERLQALLGRTGNLWDLNQALCNAIRNRQMTKLTPGLMEHLFQTSMEKVAIDQPSYATFRRALDRRKSRETE